MQDIKKFKDFEGHDRFSMPEGISRVTAGNGGETYLIDCKGKVALYDCGMAYCHEALIENIFRTLKEWKYNAIDYFLLSHTHYDHIGALPYLLKTFPKALVVAAPKAVQVFASEGARKTMKRLGEAAQDRYNAGKKNCEILVDGLRVDIAAEDGAELKIGEKTVKVIHTPGHTDCSVCYYLLPDDVMFLSESTGVLRSPGYLTTAILKNYDQALDSAFKCKAVGARTLIGSHFGHIPEYYNDRYFDLFIEVAEKEKNLIVTLYNEGKSFDEIFSKYKELNWSTARSHVQPYEAFVENANYIIKHLIYKFGNKKEK